LVKSAPVIFSRSRPSMRPETLVLSPQEVAIFYYLKLTRLGPLATFSDCRRVLLKRRISSTTPRSRSRNARRSHAGLRHDEHRLRVHSHPGARNPLVRTRGRVKSRAVAEGDRVARTCMLARIRRKYRCP
jgi:hypothetical protein